MKTILIFVDWFVPGYKAGGPIRSVANLVDSLDDTLNIFIITSDRDFNDHESYCNVIINSWNDYRHRTKVFYASPNFMNGKNIKKIIKEVNPTAVYLNSMWSFKFTLLPLYILKNNLKIKVVIAPRGMLQKGALRFKFFKKSILIFFLRIFKVIKHVYFHATDAQERLDILTNLKVDKISIISNFPSAIMDDYFQIKKEFSDLKIVFISRISPKKNLLFLLNALSKIHHKIHVELSVYGPVEDSRYFDNCLKAVNIISDNIKVNFYEPIEHNKINQILQMNHFFILPTLGENFGHAIFEAFSAGRPVMISDQTPWRDLQKHKVGFDISLSDPSGFVNAIEYAANMGQIEYDEWCEASLAYAKEFNEKSNLIEKYLTLFS